MTGSVFVRLKTRRMGPNIGKRHREGAYHDQIQSRRLSPLLRGQSHPRRPPRAEAKCGACKANLFTGEPIALTEKTFDKHVERKNIPTARVHQIMWK